MKKTISINIAGTIFYIEEDAFAKLDAYLKSIKAHFTTDPNHDEIITDMEARIAEQFMQGKEHGKDKIVILSEVEKLIKVMGTVSDFQSEESKSESEPAPKVGKRLYRDPDKAMLGGVSAGLGAYFGLDPILFQILFVILTMAGASGILIYIVLWVLIPEAKTPAQKLEMKGESMNLSSLEQTVKDRVNMAKANGSIKKFGNGIAKIIKVVIKIILTVIGVVASIGLTIAAFASTFAFATALFNKNSPYMDFPLAQVANGVEYYAVITIVYVIVILPIILLLTLITSAMRSKNILGVRAIIAIVTIWFAVITTGGVVATKYGPRFEERFNNLPEYQMVTKNFDLENFSKIDVHDTARVNLKQGTDFEIIANGRQISIDNLELKVQDGTLIIEQNWPERICFFCFGNDSTDISITLPNIESLKANGGSRFISEKLTTKNLYLELNGASRATFPDLIADNVTLDFSGSSSANISGTAKDLSITLSGASRFEGETLKVSAKTVSAKFSGSSRATMSGKTVDLKIELSGASRLYGQELISDNTEIKASGSSRAMLNVNKTLKGSLSGASRIEYVGEPQVDIDSSGSSKIIPEGPEEPESPEEFE